MSNVDLRLEEPDRPMPQEAIQKDFHMPRGPLICAVLVCLAVCATAAVASGEGDLAGISERKVRPFLETGLFAGGQTDALIWAQDNARASGHLLYVEGGLDLEWKQRADRPGLRIGVTVSLDMGSESGPRPALGLGPRLTHSFNRNWALQAQVAILGNRDGEEEAGNSLGSEIYRFKGGHQARIGLLHRNKVSAVALWRVLKYDAQLRPIEQPWAPVHKIGKAHLFCLGVMLHGKTGTYASLGSFLCMGLLTAVGSIATSS
jgi:hypothetical protein